MFLGALVKDGCTEELDNLNEFMEGFAKILKGRVMKTKKAVVDIAKDVFIWKGEGSEITAFTNLFNKN